jgi:hypothetical protein
VTSLHLKVIRASTRLSIPLPTTSGPLLSSRRRSTVSHGRLLPLALAGAPRRARQGRRVRARPGAGLPHPPQLVQRLLQGRRAQVPQLPADAVHEHQARAGAALRRPRRHRRALDVAVAVVRGVAPQG